jgi:uncharacterized protein (DUF1501 family)
MKTTRRIFLKSGALALASVGFVPGAGPSFLRSSAFAAEPARARSGTGGRKILVCVFLRGAMDGLSVVVPHGDASYYNLRQTANGGIALPRTGPGSVLDLDGHFGLHPALAALKPIYDQGFLAPIQAVGSPNATRSHFDAQDYMESAVPGDKSIHTGWLARVSAACPEDQRKAAATQIKTVSMTSQLPRSLDGNTDALAIADLGSFGVGKGLDGMVRPRAARKGSAMDGDMGNGGMNGAGASQGFEALYAGAVGDVLHGAGQETFDALKMLKGLDPTRYTPANRAQYGRGNLGNSLKQIAQLIKADVGLEIAFAEMGGWDTHVGQGAATGRLARNLDELGAALAGFWTDLGDKMSDVVVLTMSEFGRTARQNGDGGTDHGHGTCFLAMGGNVKGGQVLGDWPGLAPEQLYENRDLAVTTDFRRVFGELASNHLGIHDLSTVFPGFQVAPKDFRGVLKT